MNGAPGAPESTLLAKPPPRSRLVIYYSVLALVVAGAVAAVIGVGSGKHAEPSIAGGYAVSSGAACLSSKFEIVQSGQYVSFSNALSTLGGNLTLKHGRLTGTVNCVNDTHQQLDALYVSGVLQGTLGGRPLSALLKTDPPPPGSAVPLVPSSIAGAYTLAPSSQCLGGSMTLKGSGSAYKLTTSQRGSGGLTYRRGALAGTVACERGGRELLTGTAAGRALTLTLTPPHGAAVSGGPTAQQLSAARQRTADDTVEAFFGAAVVVLLFARLCGSIMPRLGQPRVMGEVLGGIILGPTVFGALDPQLQAKLFAPDIVPYIGVAANLGLIFYMFLIGLEVDFTQLRGRVSTALTISNTSLAVPMVLGLAVAVPLYTVLAPSTKFVAFAVFVGVSMSVTAFPVLARIISERRMLKSPLGTLALSAAALNDVSAWLLIALAVAIAGAGTGLDVVETLVLTAAFLALMALAVRPVLARAAIAYDEAGRVPGNWLAIIFAGVILSAITTEEIGVAVILGAFTMGLVMPRHAGLSHEVTQRVEDFVLVLLLPLYFAYTGLRTNVGQLGQGDLLLITLGLVAIAIVGKFGGTVIAARTMNLRWRESSALGTLMNTRGLTELIVLNIALDDGVISSALFTSLVVMAIVTTLMTGPLMRLIDPKNRFGTPPEDELAAAPRISLPDIEVPTRAILVAPQSDQALMPLLSLAELLAQSEPPRELILARLVPPPRGSSVSGGLQTEAYEVKESSDLVERARLQLLDEGISSRALAVASADPGADLARLSQADEIDLVLMDGRRPLLGDGVPREGVGEVLAHAPSDVAVLVAREGANVAPSQGSVVMVPFGGADHDWAALELAAWLCAASDATLQLLGPPGKTGDGKDSSNMLSNAALLVRQYAGVSATAVVAAPGREGIVAAASRAGLLVVGLSERWRQEGLGETRRAIARSAPAPIVFVRRGERPGALAPAEDATRFAWSTAGVEPMRAFSRHFSIPTLPVQTRPEASEPPAST